MRIGMLAPPWLPVPPTQYGGTEAVIDRLARGLVARGHEVLLWTVGESRCPVPTGGPFPRARTDAMGSALLELHHVVTGYEAFREWGADLVHDHTLTGPVHAARYPDLPVVTTNHGPFTADLLAVYRAVSDQVSVLAISHDQAARGDGVRLAGVIHHGVEVERFPAGTGEGDADGPYVLFLGRFAPEKGAREAVLAARDAGIRVLLAAKMREPAEVEYFTEQVEPLLGDDAVYLGEVGEARKMSLLAGATALINPIQWPEPFGLVMIEAMACGTPVVAFPRGAAPELVEHGVSGYLAEDLDGLAKRLRQVSSIDRTGVREWVSTWFTADRMVDEHLRLYEQIASGRSAAAGPGVPVA